MSKGAAGSRSSMLIVMRDWFGARGAARLAGDGIPSYLEASRRGVHLRVMFSAPAPAALVRRWLLPYCPAGVEFYPKQDTAALEHPGSLDAGAIGCASFDGSALSLCRWSARMVGSCRWSRRSRLRSRGSRRLNALPSGCAKLAPTRPGRPTNTKKISFKKCCGLARSLPQRCPFGTGMLDKTRLR